MGMNRGGIMVWIIAWSDESGNVVVGLWLRPCLMRSWLCGMLLMQEDVHRPKFCNLRLSARRNARMIVIRLFVSRRHQD